MHSMYSWHLNMHSMNFGAYRDIALDVVEEECCIRIIDCTYLFSIAILQPSTYSP
jgi:hypothetical protein